MRASRLAVYRSDESGRLALVRSLVRYTYDELGWTSVQSLSAAAASQVAARLGRSDRVRSIEAKAERIRETIQRLQRYPEFRCDPEMRAWTRLYLHIERLLGQMGR